MHHHNNIMNCPYVNYYTHQAGSGIGVIYKGVLYQRGHGVGSFLGGLFRSVLPYKLNKSDTGYITKRKCLGAVIPSSSAKGRGVKKRKLTRQYQGDIFS